MQGDNSGINGFVAIALFFLLLPFILMAENDEKSSKFKKLIILIIYVGIVALFFTGYIYTTPIGKFFEDLEKGLLK